MTEWEIAEHHYKLGRVLFAMGDGPQKEVIELPRQTRAGWAISCRVRFSAAPGHPLLLGIATLL